MYLASASGRLIRHGLMLLGAATDHTNQSQRHMKNRQQASQPRPVAVCWGPTEKKRLPLPIDGESVRLRPALVLRLPRQIQHQAVEADTLKPPVKYRTHLSQLAREDQIVSSDTDARGVRVELGQLIRMTGLNLT